MALSQQKCYHSDLYTLIYNGMTLLTHDPVTHFSIYHTKLLPYCIFTTVCVFLDVTITCALRHEKRYVFHYETNDTFSDVQGGVSSG